MSVKLVEKRYYHVAKGGTLSIQEKTEKGVQTKVFVQFVNHVAVIRDPEVIEALDKYILRHEQMGQPCEVKTISSLEEERMLNEPKQLLIKDSSGRIVPVDTEVLKQFYITNADKLNVSMTKTVNATTSANTTSTNKNNPDKK